MLYVVGIASHCATWLIMCSLAAIAFAAPLPQSLGFSLLLFVIGIVPLSVGSAVWMLPFLLPRLRRYSGSWYRLWVSGGAAMSIVCGLELSLTDGRPPLWRYSIPVAIAAAVAPVIATLLIRRLATTRDLTQRSS